MVRYRLYRGAVACASGPVGEALTRQLLLSPLCAEVAAVGRVARQEFEGLSASKKLRELPFPAAAEPAPAAGGKGPLEDVDAAFCVLGGGRWAAPPSAQEARAFADLCAAAAVPHVTVLSSVWADPAARVASARVHAEIAEYFVKQDFKRLSIFQPSLVLPASGTDQAPEDAAFPERAYNVLFPAVRQFMPTKFREVSLADLVLAMRLNVELCDSPERVERLSFADMMAIIGKEDTI
eukprot:SRR837773.11900.p2 GENE.SRR837773.11900~~SRR837773.11900.p2  ORF type:complete len:251 (-),score=90.79 SRR837773.11900:63-773(-)